MRHLIIVRCLIVIQGLAIAAAQLQGRNVDPLGLSPVEPAMDLAACQASPSHTAGCLLENGEWIASGEKRFPMIFAEDSTCQVNSIKFLIGALRGDRVLQRKGVYECRTDKETSGSTIQSRTDEVGFSNVAQDMDLAACQASPSHRAGCVLENGEWVGDGQKDSDVIFADDSTCQVHSQKGLFISLPKGLHRKGIFECRVHDTASNALQSENNLGSSTEGLDMKLAACQASPSHRAGCLLKTGEWIESGQRGFKVTFAKDYPCRVYYQEGLLGKSISPFFVRKGVYECRADKEASISPLQSRNDQGFSILEPDMDLATCSNSPSHMPGCRTLDGAWERVGVKDSSISFHDDNTCQVSYSDDNWHWPPPTGPKSGVYECHVQDAGSRSPLNPSSYDTMEVGLVEPDMDLADCQKSPFHSPGCALNSRGDWIRDGRREYSVKFLPDNQCTSSWSGWRNGRWLQQASEEGVYECHVHDAASISPLQSRDDAKFWIVEPNMDYSTCQNSPNHKPGCTLERGTFFENGKWHYTIRFFNDNTCRVFDDMNIWKGVYTCQVQDTAPKAPLQSNNRRALTIEGPNLDSLASRDSPCHAAGCRLDDGRWIADGDRIYEINYFNGNTCQAFQRKGPSRAHAQGLSGVFECHSNESKRVPLLEARMEWYPTDYTKSPIEPNIPYSACRDSPYHQVGCRMESSRWLSVKMPIAGLTFYRNGTCTAEYYRYLWHPNGDSRGVYECHIMDDIMPPSSGLMGPGVMGSSAKLLVGPKEAPLPEARSLWPEEIPNSPIQPDMPRSTCQASPHHVVGCRVSPTEWTAEGEHSFEVTFNEDNTCHTQKKIYRFGPMSWGGKDGVYECHVRGDVHILPRG